MNDRIRDLQREIEREQSNIDNCNHSWGKPYSNPETKREPYGYKLVGHGSDVSYESEGYRDVNVPRWTRDCTICGHSEHTHSTEAVIKEHRPKFG